MSSELAVGIDIGGTNCKIGLVSNGKVAGQVIQLKTPRNKSAFVNEIGLALSEIEQTAFPHAVAIGIGVPGLVDQNEKRILSCPNLSYLNGASFNELFPDHFVSAANDTDLALFGELTARGWPVENVLLMQAGTGLGSAFYLAGRGSWELPLAAEVGHLKVVSEGRKCGCGGHGCLEAYFSGSAILKQGKEKLSNAVNTAAEVFALASANNSLAKSIVQEAAAMLGLGIANVVNILGITRVIIGGKLAFSYDVYSSTVWESLQKNLFAPELRDIKIEKSALIDQSPILGAAAFALDRRQKIRSSRQAQSA